MDANAGATAAGLPVAASARTASMRHARAVVEGTHRKKVNRIRDTCVPVGQHAHGSRTGVIVLRVEQRIEESRLNDIE